MTNKDVEALVERKIAQAVASLNKQVEQAVKDLTASQRSTAHEVFREALPIVLLESLPAAVDEWRQRPLVVKLHELRMIGVTPTLDNPSGEQSPKPEHYAGCTFALSYAPPSDFGAVHAKPKGASAATGIGVEQGTRKTVTVYPGFSVRLPTGLVIGVPNGYEARLQSYLHSGLSVVGGVQVVHQGFLEEIWVTLRNEGAEKVSVEPGDSVALLSFCEVPDVAWQGVEDVLSCQAFGVDPSDVEGTAVGHVFGFGNGAVGAKL